MSDYDKNLKPIVKVPEKNEPIKQYNTNLSPLTKATSVAPFTVLKNSVSDSASDKIQKAVELPGRVGTGSAHKVL